MNQANSCQILVVDDDYAGTMIIRTVLKRYGFRVVSASSHDEVLAFMNAYPPDLILLNVQLAGQDAVALARQLKGNPVVAAIPIVALAAHALVGDRKRAIAAGCCGYILKPIDTRTLGEDVRKFLPARPDRVRAPSSGA
jgi:CheY-like chemotaxis protein